jgi:hypothetical protein
MSGAATPMREAVYEVFRIRLKRHKKRGNVLMYKVLFLYFSFFFCIHHQCLVTYVGFLARWMDTRPLLVPLSFLITHGKAFGWRNIIYCARVSSVSAFTPALIMKGV